MVQLQLQLEAQKAPTLNLVGLVFDILASGAWFTPAEIQKAIFRKTGEYHSDSSVTARIRDARKPAYGAHVIDVRKRSGSRAFEYRLGA